MGQRRLDELQFDNRFTRLLPGDAESSNFRRQVRGACWSSAAPAQVAAPRLLGWSAEMAEELDLRRANSWTVRRRTFFRAIGCLRDGPFRDVLRGSPVWQLGWSVG
jgi:hypothetical protein